MSVPEAEALREMLQAWEVQPRLPRDFQAQVWHRLAMREQGAAGSNWRACLELINAWAARPGFAVLFALCSMLLGAELGRLRLERERTQTRRALEERYQESINPVIRHMVVTVAK